MVEKHTRIVCEISVRKGPCGAKVFRIIQLPSSNFRIQTQVSVFQKQLGHSGRSLGLQHKGVENQLLASPPSQEAPSSTLGKHVPRMTAADGQHPYVVHRLLKCRDGLR